METQTSGDRFQMHGNHRPGGERPNYAAEAVSLARVLRHGGRALVVGGRDYFPRQYLDHPQLLFWDNTDSELMLAKREVPSNVRAIVTTRWIKHHLSEKLISVARARHLHFFPILGTGEIKRLLSEVVQMDTVSPERVEHPDQPVTSEADVSALPDPKDISLPDGSSDKGYLTREEIAPMAKHQQRGWLLAFVAKHADVKATSFAAEGRRLFAIAKQQGLKTTEGSVTQGVRVYIQKLTGSGPRATPSSAARPVKAKTTPVAPGDERLVKDIAEARRMVVELATNVKTSSDVITEMLDKLQAEVRARRERLERMRKELAAEDL